MIAATFDAALADPLLLGAALGPDLSSWGTWRTIIKAAHGQTLTEDEQDLFATIAGPNRPPPSSRVDELWVLAGRRSGKSRMAAALATDIAMQDHRAKLAPGETGFIVIMSPTREQSKVIHNYIRAFFASSPILRQMVVNHNTEEIELNNRVTIAVTTNSFRTVRSRTLIAAIFDETAFWRDETSANPDQEIYRATLPALITTGGMLIGISSPYRKIGLIHQKWRDHFGNDSRDSVLVIQAPTTTLNPTIDVERIAAARKDDPEAAKAEWDGEFRGDISSLLDDKQIDDAIDAARPLELPPRDGIQYVGFVDASAGKHDAFTLGIGHLEGSVFILDCLRANHPPFDPAQCAAEYAGVARDYGLAFLTGDAYAGRWVSDAFDKAGMPYRNSDQNKSALYLEMAPSFARGTVKIPEDPKLVRELRLLERRTSRSGRDSVDHPSNGSDDRANVLAGALVNATLTPQVPEAAFGSYGGGDRDAYYRHVAGLPPVPPPKHQSWTFSGKDHLAEQSASSRPARDPTNPFLTAYRRQTGSLS